MIPDTDSQTVPPAVLARFGSGRARPRVVRSYTAEHGFTRLRPAVVLTTDVAVSLREQGVSIVELAWHGRRIRMTVTSGYDSVWGRDAGSAEQPIASGLGSEGPTRPGAVAAEP